MNKILAFGFLTLVSLITMAEESGSPPPNPLDDLDFFQVITPLILVVTLMLGLTWLVKKMNPGLPKVGSDIKLISTTPIANQSRLCLVRVGDKDFLLGVTQTSIQKIHTFDQPISDDTEPPAPSDLSQHFQHLLKRKPNKK